MEMAKCIAAPKTPATPAPAARVSERETEWICSSDTQRLMLSTRRDSPSGQMQFAIASMPTAIRIVVRHSAAILIRKTAAKPSKML